MKCLSFSFTIYLRAIDNEKKWDIFLKKNSNQKQSHKNRWAEVK